MTHSRIRYRFADPTTDRDAFFDFLCWDGKPGQPWVEEVENHIRLRLLKHEHVLVFDTENAEISAVSAFNPSTVVIPRRVGWEHPSWHLAVVAVGLEHQRQGLSHRVLEITLAEMKALDPNRRLVTAYVHEDNTPSIRTCKRAGLDTFEPLRDGYCVLLGEL